MLDRSVRILILFIGISLAVLFALQFAGAPSAEAQSSVKKQARGNAELKKLYEDDQAERGVKAPKSSDWMALAERDKKRLTRVMEIYQSDDLKTGTDYYYAAIILQHADTPEDFLLAHELSVIAITKGEERAKWLAAASEDRFLMKIGRPQRFGTQFQSLNGGPLELYQVDTNDNGVTDKIRLALKVHTLAETKAKLSEINK